MLLLLFFPGDSVYVLPFFAPRRLYLSPCALSHLPCVDSLYPWLPLQPPFVCSTWIVLWRFFVHRRETVRRFSFPVPSSVVHRRETVRRFSVPGCVSVRRFSVPGRVSVRRFSFPVPSSVFLRRETVRRFSVPGCVSVRRFSFPFPSSVFLLERRTASGFVSAFRRMRAAEGS